MHARLTPRSGRRRFPGLLWLVLLSAGFWHATDAAAAKREAEGWAHFALVSPRPGSSLAPPGMGIILRQGGALEPGSLSPNLIHVLGSSSGVHTGELALSDDSTTIVFTPDRPFDLGERVTVRVARGVRTVEGTEFGPLNFSFTITPLDPGSVTGPSLEDELGETATLPIDAPIAFESEDAGACSLPAGYPSITVTQSVDPDPGYLFLAPYTPPIDRLGPLLILDDRGAPIFYRPLTLGGFDFTMQPDGRLTYFDWARHKYYALDHRYAVVDSFACGNGRATDFHDLRVLPNGHALLLGYDPEPVRMDMIVPGGQPDAIVTGLIVQEIDTHKNVVFEWRSWDHFDIRDAEVSKAVDLTAPLIDYVHGNAIAVDRDDNFIISSRHLNEITKIDHVTGEIIWRLGPHAKNNEFVFPNDPRGFSHQHDMRVMDNGQISLFDNGNYLSPAYSRAVTYRVAEGGRRAPLVWEYRHVPDIFGGTMGSVQRRRDGGTLIGWGSTTAGTKITELHEDGSIALELRTSGRLWTYRVRRFPWRGTLLTTDTERLDFGTVSVGGATMLPVTIRNNVTRPITLTCLTTSDPGFEAVTPAPITLSPGATARIDVRFQPPAPGPYAATLYLRMTEGQDLIAQDVALAGAGAAAGGTITEARGASASGSLGARPSPFAGTTTITFELPHAGRAVLEVYDTSGRRVGTVLDEVLPAGRHQATWAAGGLPDGLYLYRLKSGAGSARGKVMLLR